MRKNLVWSGFVFVLALFFVLNQFPDEKLHVIFCNVGQGDATLIIRKNFQMVVDGGPSGEKLLACLSNHVPFWDRKIEIVVNTHPQKDHLGGLDDLLSRFEVDRLIINGFAGGGKDGERLAELVSNLGVEVSLPRNGDVIRYGDLNFDIVWPQEKQGSSLAWVYNKSDEKVLGVYDGKDINEISVVGILRFKEFETLLTGDIGFEQEKEMLKNNLLHDIDVLKVSHHGSKYSTSKDFLTKIKPELSVIQVGKNGFGHPTRETLARLEEAGSKLKRNDLDGEIEVISDGREWWVK